MLDFPKYGPLSRILGSRLNLAVQLVDHVVAPALISAEKEGRYRGKPERAPQPTVQALRVGQIEGVRQVTCARR